MPSFHLRSPLDGRLSITVLTIVLLVGTWWVYPKVQANDRAHDTVEQLSTFAHKLDTALPTGWTTESAQKAGLLPLEWETKDPNGLVVPLDVWGGAVVVESRLSSNSTVITLHGVPSLECEKIVNADANEALWSEVRVNGQTLSEDAARQKACSSSAERNTLSFVHPKP